MRMKYFSWFLYCSFIFNLTTPAQDDNPDSLQIVLQWQQVDSLISKGLPKSALEIVDKLYVKVKSLHDPGQIIKTILYKIRLIASYEEDFLIKNIQFVEQESKNSKFPVKPLLQSMLAEMYWEYYQKNRYSIIRRTKTVDFQHNDIRTWPAELFVDKVIYLYKNSLADAEELQKLPVTLYDDILTKVVASRNFRPTIYDFLAHRALDFFSNSEAGLTRPADQFSLTITDIFLPEKEFVNITFQTPDSLALKFFAVQIMQDLIRFHLEDKNPDALFDVDLKRYKFARQNCIHNSKEKLYVQSLENLLNKYYQYKFSSRVNYEIAQYYMGEAYLYDRKGEAGPNTFRKKAYDICQDAINRFPGSVGAGNCKALQQQILYKELSMSVENVNVPAKPFRALIKYRNVQKAYLRVVKISPERIREYEIEISNAGESDITEDQNREYNLMRQFYLHLPAEKEWQVILPDDGYFNHHSVEIKMPALSTGHYVILLGTSPDFNKEKNAAAIIKTWISNLGFLSKMEKGSGIFFYVYDRYSGKLLTGVDASVHIDALNREKRDRKIDKKIQYRTNEDGYFTIAKEVEINRDKYQIYRVKVDLRYKNDRLYFDDYTRFISTKFRTTHDSKKTVFFTDRSIYRPGQTVYFKGIIFGKREGIPEILTDFPVKLKFLDVNRQKISELKVKTNEYGTFSGSFVIPTGGLNGTMAIYTMDKNNPGGTTFLVEEYKRPKFESLIQPVKGSYRLGDIVKVKGAARAYAGSNIVDAEVKYRVVRHTSFPYIWNPYYRPDYFSEQVTIIVDTTKTDEKGEFEIKFKALPDHSIPERSLPVFTYSVYADITDISGETHSTSSEVKIGYTALIADLQIPESLDADSLYEIHIDTKNLNGEFEPAKGTISVYPLKDPGRIFRKRLWDAPDRFVMEREEYYKNFPVDVYQNEDDFKTWDKGKRLSKYKFNTGKNKMFIPGDISKWKQGKYVIVLETKDKFGNKIEQVKYFTLFSLNDPAIPYHEIAWSTFPKSTGLPGEKARFYWGSTADSIYALLEVFYKDKLMESRWIEGGSGKNLLELPIGEECRGGFGFSIVYIKYGRIYSTFQRINVPWSNKKLNITFETFRNKLTPGQKEEWKCKITGPGSEKTNVEMLASMYDASLDAFKHHNWSFIKYPRYSYLTEWFLENYYRYMIESSLSSGTGWNKLHYYYMKRRENQFNYKTVSANGTDWNRYLNHVTISYDALNWFGYHPRYGAISRRARMEAAVTGRGVLGVLSAGGGGTGANLDDVLSGIGGLATASQSRSDKSSSRVGVTSIEVNETEDEVVEFFAVEKPKKPVTIREGLSTVYARKNLNETAFFYPHLRTNKDGEIIFSFTVPEALTRWKFMALAHTMDLKYGQVEREVITQKELMVQPNAPRFLRNGDEITFSARVSNLADKELSGHASLQLFDASIMNSVDSLFNNRDNVLKFTVKAGQSTSLNWKISIPEDNEAVIYRIVAKTPGFSDGEENTLAILPNRMLVTESFPLSIVGKQEKTYKFRKLIESKKSSSIKQNRLTLEITSNPAWYAIQALPYLMEFPYECTEQIFSRYYANSIASFIVNSNPKIKRVFERWKNTDALLSNLEKNQELKSILLQETPWVLEAKNETERRKKIGNLFDLKNMSGQLSATLEKLKQLQLKNGAWPWFKDMPESRYITQHIVCGMGHLEKLGIINMRKDRWIRHMIRYAVQYLDQKLREEYDKYIKSNKDNKEYYIGHLPVHYLYARSFFTDIEVPDDCKEGFNFWKSLAKKEWISGNIYLQGMIALTLYRSGDKQTPLDIIKSLKERAILSEEMGMYWNENKGGYFWYQAPVETQSTLIELFNEVTGDEQIINDMRVWLLKQKQTQSWKTTKATVEACYALLLQGSDWLSDKDNLEIKLADQIINPAKIEDTEKEEGTGYFKIVWDQSEIKPEMGNIVVNKQDEGSCWGSLYWQYFEDLDKISPHETPLKLKKQLFKEEQTSSGSVIRSLDQSIMLKPGDLIIVRIEVRADRDMEYIHMKDMRAAGLEPVHVLSRYRYQGGLGYYESTKDASTNFFISWLPEGTYVFEYPLRVTHYGNFSNGITTIQCMYAPEFSSHSQGVRLLVKEQ